MAVIVGSHGGLRLNLGNGLNCVANIFQWSIQLDREMLRRTTQADEAERRTGGLASWTGSFSIRLEFSEDENIAQSAWQIMNFALSNTDDDLKSEVELVLQKFQLYPDYEVFNSTIPGIIKLVGTVVVGSISLNCSDPEQPIIAEVSWEADGPLSLQRS